MSALEKLHRVHLAEPRGWGGASLRAGQGQRPLCPRAFPCAAALLHPSAFLSLDSLRVASAVDRKLSEAILAPFPSWRGDTRAAAVCPSWPSPRAGRSRQVGWCPALGCNLAVACGCGPGLEGPAMETPCRRQTVPLLCLSPVMEAILVALLCLVTSLRVSSEEERVLSGIDF